MVKASRIPGRVIRIEMGKSEQISKAAARSGRYNQDSPGGFQQIGPWKINRSANLM